MNANADARLGFIQPMSASELGIESNISNAQDAESQQAVELSRLNTHQKNHSTARPIRRSEPISREIESFYCPCGAVKCWLNVRAACRIMQSRISKCDCGQEFLFDGEFLIAVKK